jgi:hypothetical protein
VLHAEEDRPQVHRDDAVEHLVIDLVQGTPLPFDGGGVHRAVEATEVARRPGDEGRHRRGVRHVGRDEHGLAPGLGDLLDRLPAALLRAVGGHHVGARRAERQRDGLPHPARGTGHDGDPPVEARGHRITSAPRTSGRTVSTASSRRRSGTCSR